MPRKRTRRKVETLPPNAIKVSDYAKKVGLSIGRIYQKESEKKADFEMVLFHGANFVIPKLSEEEFGKQLIAREHQAAGIEPPKPGEISPFSASTVTIQLTGENYNKPSISTYKVTVDKESLVYDGDSVKGKVTNMEAVPKTLDELKDLCPPELKGLDRSAWISEQRQKYSI